MTGLVASSIVLASFVRAAKDDVGQKNMDAAVNLVDVWCVVLFKQGKLDEAKAEYGRGIKIDPEMESFEYNEVLKDNDESLPELEEPLFRQKLVVFSGAGISVESGIPSYRDCRGEWVAKEPEEYATAAAFYENPQKVLDYYNSLRHTVHEAKPNHAHKMLAKLEQWHDVTIITQNTDDLHERAGSTNVLHLHGELAKVTSSRNRLDPDCIKEFPLDRPIRIGDKASDGTQLRPYVVWFDEFVENMDVAIKIARDADIFVAIGTSLRVSPASLIVKYPHHSVPKYSINVADLSGRLPDDYIQILNTATKGIDKFIIELMKL